MDGGPTVRTVLGLLVVCGMLAGCTSEGQGGSTSSSEVTTTSTSSLTSTTTTTPPPPQPEERWIRMFGGQFVDTRTGVPFVPSGVNLLLKTGGGGGDKLFTSYDPDWVESQLTGITELGFNTVRFFLDMCMPCTSDDGGLKESYLDDLADLLIRLEAHDLVALPTSNDVPDPGYSDRLPCCEPFGGYRNSLYLSPEGHQIAAEYWTDLVEGVKARGAPTHHLLGWQLTNEQFVFRNVPPISMSEGSVTTADRITYDMADDEAVTEMVVSNLRVYITTVGNAIRAADDGALITMGFFSSDEPEAGRIASDERWVVPAQIIEESTLDFIDLHAYTGLGGTWPSIAAAFGLTDEPIDYPMVLGEYGAFETAYPDPQDAAAEMARWQAGSCEWGFRGWLIWFWGADKDDEVITADAHDAIVGRAVSPIERPDPCDAGDYASDNLALGRPATASAEEGDQFSAARAFDGSDATWWSAAEGPPQWIEVELAEPATVGRVEILIGSVSAPGPQTHRVHVRGEDSEVTVGEITTDASQGDWLTVEFEPVDDVGWVRVETTSVDGWVIIHEVKVLGG